MGRRVRAPLPAEVDEVRTKVERWRLQRKCLGLMPEKVYADLLSWIGLSMQEKTQSPFNSLSREELIIRAEKGAAELVEAIKELVFQNEEKAKRAAELELANKELAFQNEEKAKRAAELELANEELAFQNEENLRLHEQLFQTQKMESLGLLAGGVAHDMNNVLGAILGLSSALQDTQVTDSPAWRGFDTISKAATRGGKLVKSLLAFTRNSLAENMVLNLNEILEEEVQILARTTLSKVRLTLDMDSELRPIHGDGAALTHAIMNLCVNAVDAMPEQGNLTLRTRNIDNEWVEVVVEDTFARINTTHSVFSHFGNGQGFSSLCMDAR